jgi:hypothetical protein
LVIREFEPSQSTTCSQYLLVAGNFQHIKKCSFEKDERRVTINIFCAPSKARFVDKYIWLNTACPAITFLEEFFDCEFPHDHLNIVFAETATNLKCNIESPGAGLIIMSDSLLVE